METRPKGLHSQVQSSPENVSGYCSFTRAMSFSLGDEVLWSGTKILSRGRDGKWPSLCEPALTFQLGTSRCFLGADAGLGPEPRMRGFAGGWVPRALGLGCWLSLP